jgi:shikimate kinase
VRQYARIVLVYITGVPGSGKSTVGNELRARGYSAIDVDDDIAAWVSRDTGEVLKDPPAFEARTPSFYCSHDYRYQVDKVAQLAERSADSVCFLCGCAGGEDAISHLFARAFFLHVEPDELRGRLLNRTTGRFAEASQASRVAQVQRVLPYRAQLEETWIDDGLELINSMQPPCKRRAGHPRKLRLSPRAGNRRARGRQTDNIRAR